MNEIILNLIVLAAVLCLVAAVFWWSRRRKARQEHALRLMAAERGWKYVSIREPLAWGYQLSASGWSLEAISRSAAVEAGPGSSNIAETTCWQAPCTGSLLLIGPRLSPAQNLNEVFRLLPHQMIAREMGEIARGLYETEIGSDAVRRKYSMWARSPEEVRALLCPAVESALVHWEGKQPVIRREEGILKIEINGERYLHAKQIDALVRLGEALLVRC